MCSIYIQLRLGPAAAPLIMHMRICLGGVAMVCYNQHPAWGGYFKWKMVYYFMKRFLLPYINLERIVFNFL